MRITLKNENGKPMKWANGRPMLYEEFLDGALDILDPDTLFKKGTPEEELALFDGLDPEIIPEEIVKAAERQRKSEDRKRGNAVDSESK